MPFPRATLDSLAASADRAQAQIDRALLNIEALPSIPDESLIRLRVDLLTDLSQNIFRLAAVHKTIIALREQLPESLSSLRRLNRSLAEFDRTLDALEGRTRAARARYAPAYSDFNLPSVQALIPPARFPRDPAAHTISPAFTVNPDLAFAPATPDSIETPNSVTASNAVDAPDSVEPSAPGSTAALNAVDTPASTKSATPAPVAAPARAFLAQLDLDLLAETRCVPRLPRLNAPDIADRLENTLANMVGRGFDPTPPSPPTPPPPPTSPTHPAPPNPPTPPPTTTLSTPASPNATPAPGVTPSRVPARAFPAPAGDLDSLNLSPALRAALRANPSAVLSSAVPSAHPPPPG
jgi:hypothetical protein